MSNRLPILATAALIAATFALPAFAQNATTPKDTMAHSKMTSDSGMKHNTGMKHDTMGKSSMAHHKISHDSMSHDNMAKTAKSQ